MSNKFISIVLLISLSTLVIFTEQLEEKRPSWAVGRSLDGSDENGDVEQWHVEKKPSWLAGRDLSSASSSDEAVDSSNEKHKRIIEFKRSKTYRTYLQKYEQDLNDLKALLQQKSRGKRPSIGRTRNIGLAK